MSSVYRPGVGANRDAFDVPDGVAYFNTANLSPLLHSVRAAGEAALARRAKPWTIAEHDWFDDAEQARSLFGQLIGASADGIAVVPATSYGFAVAAHNLTLRPGERVLVLGEEYPSGVYTWRDATRRVDAEILTVTRGSEQSWTNAVLAELDEQVAVVSVPNVHWTDGAALDLAAIARRARDVDARLVIDASQSVGALPLDVAQLQPDYLISVGYKWLLGPFAIGYLYVAPQHRDGQPLEQNWILRADSQDFARLVDYRDEYQPGARRFDVGERTNFETMPMAVAALAQLSQWGIANIADSLGEVTERIADGVTELGLEPLSIQNRGPHLLGVTLPADIRAAVLDALATAGCHAAVRGASLRIAPHLHTTAEDIDTLLRALATALHRPAP